MSRIPKHFIDDLLTRIDIVDVIDARLPLKKSGSNHVACCPFHNEKTPSFSVSQTKQFYHCFGCGAHGTAITFLMEFDRFSFPEAIEALAHSIGVEVPREDGQTVSGRDYSKLYDVLNKAEAYYKKQLKNHPQAIEYLKTRGMSGKTAATFAVGFAPAGWENLVNHLPEEQHSLAVEAGLLGKRDSGGLYDRFRNRILFPIHDKRGRVIGFGGRVIDNADEPKYLNSPETPLFHKGRELYGLFHVRQNRQSNQLLLVEGYMDVVMLAEHGVNNAVAALGTSATADHIQALMRNATDIIICFDGDDAGQKAAWRAFETSLPLLDDRHQIKFLFLPEGEDPDSLVGKLGKEKFTEVVQEAQPLSQYFLGQLQQRFDNNNLDTRAQLAEFARPFLKQMSDAPLLKELLVNKIASHVGVETRSIAELQAATTPQHSATSTQRRIKLEMGSIRYAVAALLSEPALAYKVQNIHELAELKEPGMSLLLDIFKLALSDKAMNTGRIMGHYVDTPEHAALDKLTKRESPLRDNDPRISEEAFIKTIERLRERAEQARLEKYDAQQLAEELRSRYK